MSRVIGRLAFAALFFLVLATLFALGKANFAEGVTGKPYLFALPDLSSPRATLKTLLDNASIVVREISTNGVPWGPSPEILRMLATVNVSELPAARRDLQAGLAAVELNNIIGQITLPPFSEIPDAAAVTEQGIAEWRLPGTAIVLAKVASGPRKGQFLFTPETVALAGEMSDALQGWLRRGGQPATVYGEFRYMPGPLVPRAAVAALPAPLRIPVFGQALWQWIGLALLLLVMAACMLQTIAWGVRHDWGASGVFRRYGQPTAALAVICMSFFSLILVDYGLKIWGETLEIMEFLLEVIAIAAAAWLAIALILRCGDLINSIFALREASIDAQLVKVVSTLLAIGVGIGAVFLAANFVGIPLAPLLAGLGIGGVAVALAVRPTLENVIGGLTLFADRTARAGEYCRFGTLFGRVEEIGLRTTKVRRDDDALVTISNAELARSRIENYSRVRKYRFSLELRLAYRTTMQQFQEITAGIRSSLEAHEQVTENSVHVRLAGLGDYALRLEVNAHVDVANYPAFLEVEEELTLGVLDVIRRTGTQLAYPAQTNYVVRGDGLEADAAPTAPAQPVTGPVGAQPGLGT